MISQDLLTIYSVIALLSGIFSVICLSVSIFALVKVYAMEKSTHNVTFMPIDEEVDKQNQEYMKWATQDESLKEQSKYFKEDLEDSMPEFMPNDDDKKIHSF